jgi:glycerate 2-kinase
MSAHDATERNVLLELQELRRAAREIFDEALVAVDARRAVLDAVEFGGEVLNICGTRFAPRPRKIFSVALGKAAAAMASALDERLGGALSGGVLSAPPSHFPLSERWRVYEGGHPLPDEHSLAAARGALELLRETDDPSALVIFLVSGGGSAMLELARDPRLTLAELREANRVLVNCGAPIDEVNAVRRALSAVKGGGLAAHAPRATQVTLVISDVADGRAFDVASGPTLNTPPDSPPVAEIVARYGLGAKLPASVLRALAESDVHPADAHSNEEPRELLREEPRELLKEARREFHVLLDNARACEAASRAARARGFAVEVAADISDQPVDEGTIALVSRLAALHAREGAGGRAVCLISGGEFSCPVRGGGMGGRSSETALRCAVEVERLKGRSGAGGFPAHAVALCAGTDGVDGNSPAAGALADEKTCEHARALGLDARRFLDESDAYSLFARLGDAVETGATGTNVRDLRILLAG